jgi:D-amino-acid dehydrogenase
LNLAEALTYHESQRGSLIIFRDQASMDGYAAIANLTLDHGTRLSLLDRDKLLQVEPSLVELADELTGAVLFPDGHSGNSRLYCEQLCELTRARGMTYRFGVSVSQIASRYSHVKVRLDDGEELIADAAVIAAGTWSKQV